MTREAGWFPVALAADLDPGTSTGTRLFGREIVVWRDAAGASHVWEDRCPHRGMRLSFGFVRGDRLACLYHGWQFDGSARCRFIPAHPDLVVPGTITVERHASAEQGGVIWAASGVPEAGGPPGGNAAATPVRSLAVRASERAVLAALAGAASPLAPDEPATIEARQALVLLTAGGRGLAIALQPLGAGESCLHLSIVGSEPGDAREDRPRVSRWAEALRRRVEGAASGA